MLVEGIRNMDADKKYENNYVDVVDDTLNNGYVVKPNYLMRNMEIRDWQLSSFVYSNPIYLIRTLENACAHTSPEQPISEMLRFKEQFFREHSISKQIEVYCSFLQTYPDALEELLKNPHVPLFIHEAYRFLGPNRLATLQYRESNIQAELNLIKAKDQISYQCHQFFHSGQDYPLWQVKSILQSIYTSLGLTQIASASDLGLYLSITQKQLTNKETGKRELVYHIE
ncbi:MAG: hypothetical protein KBT27_02045 [Prevotellaceae bacterium]|nr:hypothetical protein [Candidatus Faecinaster equi]